MEFHTIKKCLDTVTLLRFRIPEAWEFLLSAFVNLISQTYQPLTLESSGTGCSLYVVYSRTEVNRGAKLFWRMTDLIPN